MHEEALACELAAYFHLEIGEAKKAFEYYLFANEMYQEWVSSCVDFSLTIRHINVLILLTSMFIFSS